MYTRTYLDLCAKLWYTCHGVLQCCSMLQCVAVFCSISCHTLPTPVHCVAESCRATQCVAMCCGVWQCVTVCCSVLQCVAVCCTVAVCCSVLQCLLPHIDLTLTRASQYSDLIWGILELADHDQSIWARGHNLSIPIPGVSRHSKSTIPNHKSALLCNKNGFSMSLSFTHSLTSPSLCVFLFLCCSVLVCCIVLQCLLSHIDLTLWHACHSTPT